MFSEIAQQLHLPNKLILNCAARWNAAYAMLYRALDFREVLPRFYDKDHSYISCPNEDEWTKSKKVHSFLELFNNVTELISGYAHAYSHILFC